MGEDREGLLPAQRISNDYYRDNIIFYEGNRPFGVYFLCTGQVKIIKTDSDLHSSIPRVKEAPDLLGERAFLAGEPYLGTGEALQDCRICFLDGAYFEKLFLENPQVCRALLARIAVELGRAEERLLAEFRKKGWIAVSGRDVKVKDSPRLEQVARR